MFSVDHRSRLRCLWLAVLPENLLKERPAVLHFALLLCDASSQRRMEVRQLGDGHIQHLQTGLQVRQRRLLRRNYQDSSMQRALLLRKDVPYHDLTGYVPYFPVSKGVQLLGCRHSFSLK